MVYIFVMICFNVLNIYTSIRLMKGKDICAFDRVLFLELVSKIGCSIAFSGWLFLMIIMYIIILVMDFTKRYPILY